MKRVLKILVYVTLLTTLMTYYTQGVFAFDAEQKKVLQSGVYYFNTKVSPARACGSGTALIGSENEDKIWHYFIGKGLSPVQVAGLMGNMQAESHLEPRLVEYGYKNSRGEVSKPDHPSSLDDNVPPDQPSLQDGKNRGQPGYGLVQWTAGRKQPLRDGAASKNVLASDLGLQLDNVMRELETSYKESTYDPLKAATTTDNATDIVLDHYEVTAEKLREEQRTKRRGFAKDILAKHGSDTSGASSGQVVGCSGGSGEVVGGYSLPVDRHWYDEHPDWFSKPHHDYPAADVPVPEGTNVYSMTDGTVASAPVGGDCGQGVEIDAGNGLIFKYCHGSDGGAVEGAKQGDKVVAGQLIMHSASTGESTGPHVHVEIKVDGQTRCPQSLFKSIADGSPEDPRGLPSTGCTE